MLTASKTILESRTVWANLVGLLAPLLAALGVPREAIGDQGAITDAVLQLIAGGSFLTSTLFRILATRRLL
jgi:hypothetical protein